MAQILFAPHSVLTSAPIVTAADPSEAIGEEEEVKMRPNFYEASILGMIPVEKDQILQTGISLLHFELQIYSGGAIDPVLLTVNPLLLHLRIQIAN
jgi:hypothetical protein